ncbi:MAG: hypothetical protein H7836_02115 [Magnetococcus sp. YQC-3]
MSLEYTLIIPYHRTPTVTRIVLSALSNSCHGTPELILVHWDPEPAAADLALFAEFATLRVIALPAALQGDAARFAAIDAGVAAASHDLVGILHGDTVLLRPGWDEDLFSYMERDELVALGTQAAEVTPLRSWSSRIGELWRELWHKRMPGPKDEGMLMHNFLLTRKSVLEKIAFRFAEQGPINIRHYTRNDCRIGLLSLQEVCDFMWYVPNTAGLLCGEVTDARVRQEVQHKWRIFSQDPHITSLLPGLRDPFDGADTAVASSHD